ncbi:hypothetical protein GCM10027056_02270 [Glaciibacter psychrotolerans]
MAATGGTHRARPSTAANKLRESPAIAANTDQAILGMLQGGDIRTRALALVFFLHRL